MCKASTQPRLEKGGAEGRACWNCCLCCAYRTGRYRIESYWKQGYRVCCVVGSGGGEAKISCGVRDRRWDLPSSIERETTNRRWRVLVMSVEGLSYYWGESRPFTVARGMWSREAAYLAIHFEMYCTFAGALSSLWKDWLYCILIVRHIWTGSWMRGCLGSFWKASLCTS
jgi:hypothetical protein